jgi:hypothetical protein
MAAALWHKEQPADAGAFDYQIGFSRRHPYSQKLQLGLEKQNAGATLASAFVVNQKVSEFRRPNKKLPG